MRPHGSHRRWAVALFAIVTLTACSPTIEESSDMTLDEARSAMLTHVEAVTAMVGSGWADRYEPTTFSCSLPSGDGLQWTLAREGTVAGTAQDAADVVREYFESQGFDVRVREDDPSTIDVIARGGDGLDIQFGAVDNGFSYIDAQSVCIPE